MSSSASSTNRKKNDERSGSSSSKKNIDKKETPKNKSQTATKDNFLVDDPNENEDEPQRAPLQLKIEFVNSIMFRQWDLAKKLCQFLLMYEPDNKEAKQYAPLIEYMLNKEESSSSDDNTDDDDDDDEQDSSDSDDTTSSQSSNDQDNIENNGQAATPVNASLSNKLSTKKQ